MISIIDYGLGNLGSIKNMIEHIEEEVQIISDISLIKHASKLILPGVGAFSDAMVAMRDRGLVEPIQQHIAADRPFLGICMGLQLLFQTGWEGGRNDGLGVFAGDVCRFDCSNDLKVPHMGWNEVRWREGSHVSEALDRGVQDSHFFYFVHSYYVRPSDTSIVIAETNYGDTFCSGVSRGRLLATQFHPEKSQSVGMRLLKYFIDHV